LPAGGQDPIESPRDTMTPEAAQAVVCRNHEMAYMTMT